MNFFILRNGEKQGPYPLSSLSERRRYGGLLDSDEILVDGAANWVRLADYLPPEEKTTKTPPPLPPQTAVAATLPPPLPKQNALAVPSDELVAAVQAGGRFVLFTYCISVLVLSFRRSSRVKFLRRDEDGAGEAIKFSVLSGLLGWWGIPWGPIWTIAAIISNARGGKDVTHAVLADKYGPTVAGVILARRQKPAPAGALMKTFWGALIAVPVLVFFLASWLGAASVSNSGSTKSSAFDVANHQIDAYADRTAFGNSAKAVAVASNISRSMKALRALGFEGGNKNGLSMSGHEFLTYCDLRADQCIVLIHVPELRHFSTEAKDSLASMAWGRTEAALRQEQAGASGMKVLVGLRGIALYDRVMKGSFVADENAKDTGPLETERDGRDALEVAFEHADDAASQPPAEK